MRSFCSTRPSARTTETLRQRKQESRVDYTTNDPSMHRKLFRPISRRIQARGLPFVSAAHGLKVLIASACLFAGVPGLAGEGTGQLFRAGAARADITPPLGSMLIGLSFVPRPATDIHDPLLVRALVLDDGASRLAFVVCDNLGLSQLVCDEARRRVMTRTGLPASHLLVAATHTHSAPTSRGAAGNTGEEYIDGYAAPVTVLTSYQELLANRIADAVEAAINRLEPARIGWGSARAPEHVFNRRWYVKSELMRRNPFGGVDLVRMNPTAGSPELIAPAAPTDAEIAFLSVQTLRGKPLALFANYSLHYVGGVPLQTISGDYFAVFDQEIGERLKGEGADETFVGIMSNGTSGDINNIDFRQPREPRAPYEQINRVAKSVADHVHGALENLTYHDWVKLDARYEELSMKPRKPTAEMFAYAREVLAKDREEAAWHSQEGDYARRILLGAAAPEFQRVPIQTLRIGDLGVAAIPAEVLVEIGLELKTRSPFQQAFTISFANGYFGYLSPINQHELGGYETWVGNGSLEVEAASGIVESLLRMWGEMR